MPILRRRRTAISLVDPTDTPFFLDETEERKRSVCNLKDLAEAYFRSVRAQSIMFLLSILSCVLFVAETYQEDFGTSNVALSAIEFAVSLAFLGDYVLSLVFALDRWAYAVSFNGIVDLLSILPLGSFLAFHSGLIAHISIDEGALTWLEVGNLCRILRGLKVFRVMRFSETGDDLTLSYTRRRLTGPSALDDSQSVTVRIFKLIFWFSGT